MKVLTNNITSASFLEIVNQNFSELASARNESSYATITTSDNFIQKINDYYGTEVVKIGMKGSALNSIFTNNFFCEGCSIDPNPPRLEWAEDYLIVTVSDNNNGLRDYEIWEKYEDGDYTLIDTIPAGTTNYNYKTWQNATLNIKIKAKSSKTISQLSDATSIKTPLVFRCTIPNEINRQVDINTISMGAPNKLMVINWGDGNTTEVTSQTNTFYQYIYSSLGTYWIHFTGDVDYINQFELYGQQYLAGTKVDKWRLPTYLTLAHFYSNGFQGNITHLYENLPANCVSLHFGGNYVTCDMTKVKFTDVYWDIHFNSLTTPTASTGIFGDISSLILPDTIAHFNIEGYIYGNISSVIPWKNTTYGTILLTLVSNHPTGLTGDLSGWTIPDKPATLRANTNCHFTKLPRGSFKKVSQYNFAYNSCDQTELDNLLTYIDNYFSGGVVPEVDCVYTLLGTGMGIPSATGLAAKASIEAKYAAAGKTAIIYVNT